ncbi:MAG TPA: MucR family transcriptional regulator [Mesorhizobium sp.]|jgi:predicted transcriptional regulator|nr:MucR family transcriptional regulator [Mesorhizobium sp.]
MPVDVEHVTDIVAAYLENNQVPVAEVAALIASVGAALTRLDQPQEEPKPELTPAVNPKKSVFPDYIISLEDGKRYKSLKRHLSSRHGLTPQEYRQKWNLPADYPMVAPNYAAARSALAKSLGLGRKRQEAAAPAAAKPAKKPAKRRTKQKEAA